MNDWIFVSALETIPRSGARVITTGEIDIALFRTSDDRVFAIQDRCPHQGGPLSQGIVYGHTVACPLHNWSIDLHTGAAIEPDEGCTGHYPVQVENGQVFIQRPLSAVAKCK